MPTTTLSSQPTEQAIKHKAASRLLALYGVPPQVRTEYATRFNNELWRKEVRCPQCSTWQRLSHNAHCHRCCIDLAHVIAPAQEVAQ